jgi:predicted transcriptional regulator
MRQISVRLSDEQASLLDQMVRESGQTEELIMVSAIVEFYQNYTAWKRRLSLEKKEGGGK